MTNREFDEQFRRRGAVLLGGIDEAGRGPLAGPVFAAAVILDPARPVEGLNDSKKLSEAKREALFDPIREQAVAWAVASASVEEIEKYNILGATFLAMRRAAEQLQPAAQLLLVDGNRMPPDLPVPARTIVKGDALSETIAAASILAKVSRDRYIMEVLDRQYPQYQFARHKGYGTKLHYACLNEYGPCPAHRKTFLKKWEAQR